MGPFLESKAPNSVIPNDLRFLVTEVAERSTQVVGLRELGIVSLFVSSFLNSIFFKLAYEIAGFLTTFSHTLGFVGPPLCLPVPYSVLIVPLYLQYVPSLYNSNFTIIFPSLDPHHGSLPGFLASIHGHPFKVHI